MRKIAYLLLVFRLCSSAQTLPQQIAIIAIAAHGKVSVACSLSGSSSFNCDLNPNANPPMQSVFKLPLVITALHLVDQGEFTMQQPIRFRASDRILPHTVSPLQDKYPAGEVDVPFAELLRLTIVESDNAAADIILRNIGGPTAVNQYITWLGIHGFHLQDNEAALHQNVQLQYRNWFEPAAAVQLLQRISDPRLLTWMQQTTRGSDRIKGLIPSSTVVMHRPGSSDTDHGLTHAWNDIGLITLPDSRRLAIAIFLTDSTATENTRDQVIAQIARAAYDRAIHN